MNYQVFPEFHDGVNECTKQFPSFIFARFALRFQKVPQIWSRQILLRITHVFRAADACNPGMKRAQLHQLWDVPSAQQRHFQSDAPDSLRAISKFFVGRPWRWKADKLKHLDIRSDLSLVGDLKPAWVKQFKGKDRGKRGDDFNVRWRLERHAALLESLSDLCRNVSALSRYSRQEIS